MLVGRYAGLVFRKQALGLGEPSLAVRLNRFIEKTAVLRPLSHWIRPSEKNLIIDLGQESGSLLIKTRRIASHMGNDCYPDLPVLKGFSKAKAEFRCPAQGSHPGGIRSAGTA